MIKSRRRRGHRKDAQTLKDRLIQTRVPRDLESALKDEASRRRLSVSHLIRNVLEDTFNLVDNVVAEVDNLVSDSVELANQVRRDARKIARSATRAGKRGSVGAAPSKAPRGMTASQVVDPLGHVYAWNRVVLNRASQCARCERVLDRGSAAHLGLTPDPAAEPIWLCDDCAREL
jgi:hypothetical protein